jgi:hypothetical protein
MAIVRGRTDLDKRPRMIEDMMIRKLAPKIQQSYIRAIKDFSAFLGRSPDTASFEVVRRFQLHSVSCSFRASPRMPCIGDVFRRSSPQ